MPTGDFPQTVTQHLGHAQVYPARPIPPLHELRFVWQHTPAGSKRKRIQIRHIACTEEEHLAVCEFLAERRIGGAAKPAGKRKAVPRNKAI